MQSPAADRLLAKFLSRAFRRPVDAETRKQYVAKVAERLKADLIVMSSHRVDPATAVQSLSMLSYQVSILCDCPVLFVK